MGRVKQIAEGLRYMHLEARMVHLDLKSDNVFISSRDNVKIADIGISQFLAASGSIQFSDESGTQKIGSKHYRAPEVGANEENIGRPCDMWALGLLISEMCTGKFVAARADEFDLRFIYQSKPCVEWLISETSGISKFFGDLVSKLLDWDPETRLDVAELCEILDQATITPKGSAVGAVDWGLGQQSEPQYIAQLEKENARLVEMVSSLQGSLKHSQEMQRMLMTQLNSG